MKIFTFLGILCGTVLVLQTANAQDGWPKTSTTSSGAVIKLYQWQHESFSDNTLQSRAAISVLESGKTEPVFGVAWLKATTITNGQQVQVQSIYITDIKLPDETDNDKLEQLAVTMENQATSWHISFPLSELQSAIDLNKKQTELSAQLNNTPPKVIYSNVPSILVQVDGTPKLQYNSEWGVEAVVNTPFAIVKNNDGRFYLYGGKHWYTATSVTGNYALTTNTPQNLSKIEQSVNEANKDNQEQETDANTIYKIITSTEPAELIQTNGEPNFAAVQGTGLLYVSNTNNDIFMDVNSQKYYVLISGRWYQSKTLSGQWQYTGADKLPEDFAKIPEGSPKDNVLASVAGTDQADDAIKDAQVPQTAKVDRSKAKAAIIYDGDPEFEVIDGTDMAYAINTPASVVRWRNRYYAVDNGIWFESYNAVGPWSVAVVRPYAVALIPPRYPVYYMKYVYIYDVTPDYVYMGYTPGYLNTYIYGPTVVYGTGYYYRPWYGSYYYPRPCTWGYGVRYNPWYGWGLNVGFSTGWFHVNLGFGSYRPSGYWGYGGWWGPRVYRPPYCYTPYRNRGYYGGGGWYGGGYPYSANRGGRNINITNINYNNNIYRARRDVVTRDNQRNIQNNRNRDNGRQSWAGNNRNRVNNANGNNRFDNRTETPRNRFTDRSNGRPDRQFNNGNRGNNNRNLNADRPGNTYNRERLLRDGNNLPNNRQRVGRDLAQPQREGDNNRQREANRSNNRFDNRNDPGRINNTPPNRERIRRDMNVPNTNRFENRNNSGSDNRNDPGRINTPPNRERIRRDMNAPNTNRFENRNNNSSRQENIRRMPERSIQPQNREPVRRSIERPNTMRQNNNNRPQVAERSPRVMQPQNREPVRREYSRPPERNSVRRGDAGGGNNNSARPSRSGGDNGRRGGERRGG